MQPTTGSTKLSYAEFARLVYNTSIISDPWIDGGERFRLEPVVLPYNLHTELYSAAREFGALFDELASIVWGHPDLLGSYFGLTPYQRAMWLASGGRWHGIARLDLFVESDGTIRFCEMNSDTPSGEAEAVIINEILHPFHPQTIDPNVGFRERFVAMSLATHEASGNHGSGPPNVGILYPTDLPEDLSMIALYRSWFEQQGCRVVLGSPFNIHRQQNGGVAIFDVPIDLMLRHYKTDWWGEREPAWLDEPGFNDPNPIDPQTLYVLDADMSGRLSVVNPFGSVLTQNKLSMAFLWEEIERFSPNSRRTIERYVPETRRVISFEPSLFEREAWVLKSDYGCEGEEVVIGPNVTDDIWQRSLEQVVPNRWIAQRYFNAAPLSDGSIPNYGVYLIAGEPAGYFTRISHGATNYTSSAVATFITPPGETNHPIP